jgi:hypothetical protein
MSWDFSHEANPKSAKGRPDREALVGKPIDETMIPRRLMKRSALLR